MKPEDIDLLSNDPIFVYSEKESLDRLETLQDLFLQHLGKKWKIVLFLLMIFIIVLLLLLAYGITVDREYKHHLQAFFIVFIISLSFWVFYVLISPNKEKSKLDGVVPFPKNFPYVPVDDTKCGTSIINCTSNNDICDTNCSVKDSSNYECTLVDKNVIYLGTKLEKGQSYCLPKKGNQKLKNCGTYTGKAVWTANQEWECQCLYPDFFGGDYCLDQKGCQTVDQKYILVDKNNNNRTWDPTSSDDPTNNILSNHSPYDTDQNGNPVYKCGGGDGKCLVFNGDPFTCHSDLCYVGMSGDDKFDPTTMTCDCGIPSQSKVIKSNISGFCYPYGNQFQLCQPHDITSGCTFGLDFSKDYYLFTRNGIDYLTNKDATLTDVTSLVKPNKPLVIDNLLIKDAFYAYPIVKPTTDLKTILATAKTDIESFNVLFNNASKNNGGFVGYPSLCSSFYQKRDGYPTCKDILSTTGAEYNIVCDKSNPSKINFECGTDIENGIVVPVGNCSMDISQTDSITGLKCTNCQLSLGWRDPQVCIGPQQCGTEINSRDPYPSKDVSGQTCFKCLYQNESNVDGWKCCNRPIYGHEATNMTVCGPTSCPGGAKACN